MVHLLFVVVVRESSGAWRSYAARNNFIDAGLVYNTYINSPLYNAVRLEVRVVVDPLINIPYPVKILKQYSKKAGIECVRMCEALDSM